MIITKSYMRFSYARMSEIYIYIFLKHRGTWVEPTVFGRFHMILEIYEEPREGHEAVSESLVSPGFRSTPNTVECTPLNVYLISFWNLECIYSVLEFE